MTIGQYYIERYYARGASRQLPPTPFQQFKAAFGRTRVRPAPALAEVPWVAPHD